MTHAVGKVVGDALKMKISDIPKMCPFMQRMASKEGGMSKIPLQTIASLASKCPVASFHDGPLLLEDDIPKERVVLPAPEEHGCPFSTIMETRFKDFQSKFGPVSPHECSRKHVKQATYAYPFEQKIKNLYMEGRYRTFANLQRHVGSFPNASYRPPPELQSTFASEKGEIPVKISCSNDYL